MIFILWLARVLFGCVGWCGKGGRTSQEAVELHQELEVDVVALGGTAVSALHVVAVQIDTCEVKPSSANWFKHAQKRATLSCAFANKMVPWSQGECTNALSLLAYRG